MRYFNRYSKLSALTGVVLAASTAQLLGVDLSATPHASWNEISKSYSTVPTSAIEPTRWDAFSHSYTQVCAEVAKSKKLTQIPSHPMATSWNTVRLAYTHACNDLYAALAQPVGAAD